MLRENQNMKSFQEHAQLLCMPESLVSKNLTVMFANAQESGLEAPFPEKTGTVNKNMFRNDNVFNVSKFSTYQFFSSNKHKQHKRPHIHLAKFHLVPENACHDLFSCILTNHRKCIILDLSRVICSAYSTQR